MELAGHAEELGPQRIDIAGADRKMLVAPEGGRQRLDLKVAEIFQDVAAAAAHMPEVEEERPLRIAPPCGLADALEKLDLRLLGEFEPVLRIGPVEPLRLHLRLRPGRRRDEREADVDEDSVAIREEVNHLVHLPAEIVEVGRVEVEEGPTWPERLAALTDKHAFRRDDAPAGMFARRKLIPAGGDIDRCVDPGLVQRVELRARQIEIEVRMLLADLGRVIGPAVMALGEDRDANRRSPSRTCRRSPSGRSASRCRECARRCGSRDGSGGSACLSPCFLWMNQSAASCRSGKRMVGPPRSNRKTSRRSTASRMRVP